MSVYDSYAAAHEAHRLCTERALIRAAAPQLLLNSPSIVSSVASVVPAIDVNHLTNRQRYPLYRLGYRRGDRVVTRPSQVANPPAVHNQVDKTSNHTYINFTGTDLPPLLFRIEPYQDILANVEVPLLHDAATNQPVVTNRGATLRFFSFLPRYISYRVDGALLEFWFRLDHRLEMNDILMRIESGPGVNPASAGARNVFNMRRSRFREAVGIPSWNDCRRWPVKSDLVFAGGLTREQICLNTTMKYDPVARRLLKPIYSDSACTTFVGYMDALLPLQFFLSDVITTIPSKRMIATIALRHRVQEVAVAQGRGAMPESWQTLDRDDEPPWWNDRKKDNRTNAQEGRSLDEIDGLSYAEWMEAGFGGAMDVGIAKRARLRGAIV